MEEQAESGSTCWEDGGGGDQGPRQEYEKHAAAKWGGSDQPCKITGH